MPPPGIVILGMHRAGTSLVAELAARWGAAPGPSLPADRWNPRGYGESRPLVAFDEELLARLGAHWSVPPTAAAVAGLAADPALVERGRRLLAGLPSPWLLKDPRLAFLLPFWKRVWGDPAVLVTVRHPAAVAASLARRDRFGGLRSRVLWRWSYGRILAEAPAGCLFLSYERLLAAPEEECARLAGFLRGRWPERAPAQPLAAAIDPALTHAPPAEEDPHHAALLALLDGAAPPAWEPAPWERIHLEECHAADLLRGELVGLRAAEVERARLRRELAATRAERDALRDRGDALARRLRALEESAWQRLGEAGRNQLARLEQGWRKVARRLRERGG